MSIYCTMSRLHNYRDRPTYRLCDWIYPDKVSLQIAALLSQEKGTVD